MRGVNKAIIVGNLGDDPKSNVTGSGTAVTNFSVATSESWVNSNGERQERTEWHRVVAWRKLAEIAGSYLRKGSKVYIEGKLQTRAWEDSNGEKRYTTEIVADELRMLDGRDEAPTVSVYTPPQQAGDDLPF